MARREEGKEQGGGGTKDHTWRICTVDRISRAGHARNLAERNHVLPRFGESERAFRRGCRGAGGAGSVTTVARLSLEEERYGQSSSFCQPDPKIYNVCVKYIFFSFF